MYKYDYNKLFILYEPNSFVNAYTHPAIYDLKTNKIHIISKDLYLFCIQNNKKNIKYIIERYINKNIVFEYLDFLLDNNLAFIGSEHDAKNFRSIKLEWDNPSKITNCIIEHSEYNLKNIDNIISIFNTFYINTLLYINYKDKLQIYDIDILIEKLEQCINFKTLIIFTKYDEEDTEIKKITNYLKQHIFIEKLIIHSSPFTDNHNELPLYYTDEKITSSEYCGIVSPEYFSLNLQMFTESNCYNSCLNRKICIDRNGNIKNCIAMSKTYGNIHHTSIETILKDNHFIELWHISKNKIDVCKDCEFRYTCTDCRFFIKDPQNIYSQPAKCTYNPYVCKWEGEVGYVPVEDCGTYSPETGFIANRRKITALNKKNECL